MTARPGTMEMHRFQPSALRPRPAPVYGNTIAFKSSIRAKRVWASQWFGFDNLVSIPDVVRSDICFVRSAL